MRYAGPGRLRAGAFAAEVVVVRDGVVVASTAPSPDAWFASLDVGHGLTVDLSRTVPAVEWCAGGASEPGPFPALAPGSYQVVPVVRVVAPRVVLAGVDAAETGEDVVLVGQPVDLTVR